MEKDEKEKEKKENADLAMPRKRSSLKNTMAESGSAAEEAEEVFTLAWRPAFLVDDLAVVAELVEAASEDFFFLTTVSRVIVRPMVLLGWRFGEDCGFVSSYYL